MKKNGFTLAEVLITLGVIGIVAALTLPLLNQDVASAQIGPKLFKAASSFEQAVQAVLNDQGEDRIDGLTCNSTTGLSCLSEILPEHLKVIDNNVGDNLDFQTKDGVRYRTEEIGDLSFNTTSQIPAREPVLNKNTKPIRLLIDINAMEEPNRNGIDEFYFTIMQDGSLVAYGSAGFLGNGLSSSKNNNVETSYSWGDQCKNDSVPVNAAYCAGSIYANNGKVKYIIR